MKSLLLATLFSFGLIACTGANPEVEALLSASPFNSKSEGPFEQDQAGNYFTVSGFCLKDVTGFEARLDDMPIWTAIPATTPTPDSTKGEYLVGNPEYDVDCSDSKFNFYIFHSMALQNYSDNGQAESDPYKIEIRALSHLPMELPSLVFERRPATTIEVSPFDYNGNPSFLEPNQYIKFRITLRDAKGEDTRAGKTDIPFTLTAENLSTATSVGIFKASDCSTTLNSSQLVFSSSTGNREIEVCYYTGSVTDGSTVVVKAQNASLEARTWTFVGKAQNSAVMAIHSYNGNSGYSIPPYIVKGVDYRLRMILSPLVHNNVRSISSFVGSFSLVASPNTVAFQGLDTAAQCPGAIQYGSIACGLGTYTNKEFLLKVPVATFTDEAILIVNAVPSENCGSNCTLYDSGSSSSFNIMSYVSTTIRIPVISGDGNFTKMYFDPKVNRSQESTVKAGQCESAIIGAANSNGSLIPVVTALSMTVGTTTNDVRFYNSFSDCSNDSGSGPTSLTVSVAAYDVGKMIYFKIPAARIGINGQVTFNVGDGTATESFHYYLQEND